MPLKQRLSLEAYFEGIRKGDRRILSKALSLVESTLPSDRELSKALIERCYPYSGKAQRLVITGTPGVGKSTLIEALGYYAVEQKKRRLAVIAIDPKSQRSGGSILGDKTRMQRLAFHPNAYIRPASGNYGGIAHSTLAMLILCEAAGFDLIFIETIGVGQSETIARALCDLFLLLIQPGGGDELQGLKRGIMEMADLLVITKADGELLPLARKAKTQYSQAMRLMPLPPYGFAPKVLMVSALQNQGIDTLYDTIQAYFQHWKQQGYLQQLRKEQQIQWIYLLLQNLFEERRNTLQKNFKEIEKQVIEQRLSPFAAAEKAIQWLMGCGS